MTLFIEQSGGNGKQEDSPSSVFLTYQGWLATQEAVRFAGPRPRTVRRQSKEEKDLLQRLRTVSPPTLHPEWKSRMNCTGVDPDLFFADPGTSETQMAKEVYCTPCPVQGDCLLGILKNPEPFGVWGGFDHNERKSEQFKELGAAMLTDYSAG